MKSILVGTFLALAGVVMIGCSGAESPDGTSTDEALSTSSAAPANTIMKVTPPNFIMKVNPGEPTAAARRPTTTSAGGSSCAPGEKICELANDKGICVDRCVPDNVMCVAPNCVVCDPAGPRPNPACTWDSESCQWDCPVCDPSGPAPEPGCHWDSKACVWLCL